MTVFNACFCQSGLPGCCLQGGGTSRICAGASCCPGIRRRGDREVTAKSKTTPLPLGKLTVISAVLFVNHFGINILFPFLPFMIHDFFPDLDRTEIGQKAGYLGCAYFVGNFIGSLFWGWLSDMVGRRPIILTGMCGIIFAELLFAFSQNFAWAVAARFLWGALNGNIGLVKTYISEICDDSNQAKGFAIVGTINGVGTLMGSVVGGFLAQPALKYPSLQLPIFCEYPYSLPLFVGAGMSFGSLVATWLFIDETLYRKKKKPYNQDCSEQSEESSTPSQSMADSGIEMATSDPLIVNVKLSSSDILNDELNGGLNDELNDELNGGLNDEPNGGLSDGVSDDDSEQMVAESDMNTDSEFERVSSDTNLLIRKRTEPALRKPQCPRKLCFYPLHLCFLVKKRIVDCIETPVVIITYLWRARKRGSWSPSKNLTREDVAKKAKSALNHVKEVALLIVDRRVFLGTFLYALFALIAIMGNELLPLLLLTEHVNGGYNMDDSEIGVVLMVTGVLQLTTQVLLFSKITKCIGYRNTFRVGLVIYASAAFLLPFSNQITGPIQSAVPSNGSSPDDPVMSGDGMDSSDSNYCNYTLTSNATSSYVNENSVLRVTVDVWIVLILISSLLTISRMMCITSTMVLINNASLPATKGTVNGIGQSLAAFGRSIGPVIGAPVFAWSEGLGLGWPLNFHFVFDLMCLSSIAIIFITFLLPKSIEKKRETPDTSLNNTSART